MRKFTRKMILDNEECIREPIDMRPLLNYGIANLLNKSILNDNHVPEHYCNPNIMPDYIAFNSQKNDYFLTDRTAVAFFTFDKTFDKIDGLYSAIYYNDKKLLTKFRKQFSGVRFVIAPDYSIFDDVWRFENEYRLFKTRIIMLWFCGFKFERNFTNKKVAAYRDPEWQAKCFAGELLIPAHLMVGCSIEESVDKCGVSYDAAEIQYRKINAGRSDSS